MPEATLPDSTSDDYGLLAGIARGDAACLGALYDRHGRMVLAYCLRILGSRSDAEEVLGDVFWQVWQQASSYDAARGTPLAYLMTVARTRSLDRLRAMGRKGRMTAYAGDPGEEHVQTIRSSDDPLAAAMHAEQRARVEAALGALDPAQRTVVEMSFFEEMSHSEIAERLGEPLGTVKTRIRTGLIRLRDGLQSQYGGGVGA